MIYDCFLFFNELDLLEIRLNSLAPYVDRFVLCESDITHSGKPKPLYYEPNKERFKDFPITHLVMPEIHTDKPFVEGELDGYAWKREHRQRDYIMNGLGSASDDDMIILSDLDEIPDLERWDGKSEGAFKQWMYYYYFNVHIGVKNWKGSVVTKKKNIVDMNDIRNRRNKVPSILNPGGWHFSTLGTVEDIKYKINSFSHRELDTKEFVEQLESRRKGLLDPFNRGADNWRKDAYKLIVEMPTGPKWLLDNQDKYPHLFYKP